jgi:hypothetical protein
MECKYFITVEPGYAVHIYFDSIDFPYTYQNNRCTRNGLTVSAMVHFDNIDFPYNYENNRCTRNGLTVSAMVHFDSEGFPYEYDNNLSTGWDLAKWSERCVSISKITGSNPSGGSKLTFRSDLLLTARGGST